MSSAKESQQLLRDAQATLRSSAHSLSLRSVACTATAGGPQSVRDITDRYLNHVQSAKQQRVQLVMRREAPTPLSIDDSVMHVMEMAVEDSVTTSPPKGPSLHDHLLSADHASSSSVTVPMGLAGVAAESSSMMLAPAAGAPSGSGGTGGGIASLSELVAGAKRTRQQASGGTAVGAAPSDMDEEEERLASQLRRKHEMHKLQRHQSTVATMMVQRHASTMSPTESQLSPPSTSIPCSPTALASSAAAAATVAVGLTPLPVLGATRVLSPLMATTLPPPVFPQSPTTAAGTPPSMVAFGRRPMDAANASISAMLARVTSGDADKLRRVNSFDNAAASRTAVFDTTTTAAGLATASGASRKSEGTRKVASGR